MTDEIIQERKKILDYVTSNNKAMIEYSVIHQCDTKKGKKT